MNFYHVAFIIAQSQALNYCNIIQIQLLCWMWRVVVGNWSTQAKTHSPTTTNPHAAKAKVMLMLYLSIKVWMQGMLTSITRALSLILKKCCSYQVPYHYWTLTPSGILYRLDLRCFPMTVIWCHYLLLRRNRCQMKQQIHVQHFVSASPIHMCNVKDRYVRIRLA